MPCILHSVSKNGRSHFTHDSLRATLTSDQTLQTPQVPKTAKAITLLLKEGGLNELTMCVPVILLLLTSPDHLEKRSSKCPDIQLQRVCGEELKTETTERERGQHTGQWGRRRRGREEEDK